MSEAFYCDHCDEYHDGDPTESLYRKEVIDRQRTDYIKVADLCDECSELMLEQ